MSSMKTPRGYKEDFDGAWYLAEYYNTMDTNKVEGDMLKFRVDMLHDIFATGTIKGEKLLDIGTGPCVYSIVSASRHVTEIHLSDYLEKNREIEQSWRDGAPNAECVFEYIRQKENDGTTLEARVNEVRDKVKKIFAVDLLQPHPIEELDCKYDVITSSFCLEVPGKTVEEHGQFVAKVADIIKPGGNFVLVGVTGSTFYKVGEFSFHNLAINMEELKSNIMNAGFEIKIWKEAGAEGYHPEDVPTGVYDADNMFVMAAQKKA